MDKPVTLITGTRKGIGRYLAQHFVERQHHVIGCSRRAPDWTLDGYWHLQADVASKAAVQSLTHVLAREFAGLGITVNAIGPTPVDTDLIRAVPADKIDDLVNRQAIPRQGTYADVANVVDFFLRRESDFVTGQTLYLGGV